MEVVQLEVVRPDGRMVPVDVAANSKESIDDSQMEMNIHDPNDRMLRVNIPNVEIGDVVHSVSRQTIGVAYMPGQFADETVLEEPAFILHSPTKSTRRRIARLSALPCATRCREPSQYSTQTGPTAGDPSLGNPQRAAHVRRTGHAALRNGVAAPATSAPLPDWHDVSKWYWT